MISASVRPASASTSRVCWPGSGAGRRTDAGVAEKRAGELGGELLGFYHSHPDHPARPSQFDLDHAWPTFAYVIVSVASGAASDMTVWYLKEDRSNFEEGDLHGDENPDSHAAPAVHR